ncbi:unnamed protein product [Linum trigynum]|uniref:Uncharacterized protein n=1 Tax=Linum trigynum TaxID=586398 RepID=A0AAV2G5W2_9ROSI
MKSVTVAAVIHINGDGSLISYYFFVSVTLPKLKNLYLPWLTWLAVRFLLSLSELSSYLNELLINCFVYDIV